MKRAGLLLALILMGALGVSAPRAQQAPSGATQTAPCEPGAACEIRRSARQNLRKAKPKTGKQAKPAASKQAQPAVSKPDLAKPIERTPYEEQDREAAIIPGLPGVRFWADSFGAFADALPPDKGPWLILSSGGSSGAYGAGVLVGLSQAGKRPEFSVVTGVSIGAVMAPYAFLGAKYDDQLRDSFLNLTSADVFEDAVRADSLVDTWPLKNSLAKRVTPEVLADIAAEHRKGRRLFVVTADLDSSRAVIWNMGAIAAHGSEAALNLFRQVLLAASAIPGVFPPVYIDVEAQGRKFQEMHADGGVFGPFFVAPPSWLIEAASAQLPADKLYVIIHSKLVPEFELTGAEKIFILGRTISAAVKAGAQAELALLSTAAKRDGIELNVAYVDGSFRQPAQTAFDQKQMTALFNLGLEQAKNGTAFRTQNPSGQAQSK
jgi:Patatin-like phospholipase